MAALPKGCYVQLPTPTGPQRWRLAYRRMVDFGRTDWGKRTVWLRPGQSPAELADTLIHEAVHVATGVGSEDTLEEVFERVANGATAMLLTLGLIRSEDED